MLVGKPRLSLNAALWITAVPVALAAIRVLMFSRGDATLLRVLLETLQIVPVLMATSLLILPWAFFIIGAILLMNGSARAALWAIPNRRLVLMALYVLGIVVIWTSPVYWAVVIAVTYALVITVAVMGRSSKEWAKRVVRVTNILDTNDLPSIVVGVAIIPLLIGTLTAWSSFWLPRENVTVGIDDYDGYVLTNQGDWTTILTTERTLIRVPSEDIMERVICDQWTVATLQNLILPKPGDVPECAQKSPS
ncbi:hypothetical protein GCM10009816_24090 [Microbacterium aquimaris]